MIAVSWGSSTDPGPRPDNQDALLAEPPIFVVADGMGGHAAGELASAIVVETFKSLIGRGDVTPNAVSELIGEANQSILWSVQEDGSRRGMGTTVVALVMVSDGKDDYWLVANLGDSRVYRFAHGKLKQLTVDHSYVQELVDAGRITAEAARTHPQRNIITRVLGSVQPPEAEYWLLAPEVGERYLLCSDGLFAEMPDEDIARLMAEIADPGMAAAVLVKEALVAGGRDNATAIVVDVLGIDPTRTVGDVAAAARVEPPTRRGRRAARQGEDDASSVPPISNAMIRGVPAYLEPSRDE
jgi:protein phosphatase